MSTENKEYHWVKIKQTKWTGKTAAWKVITLDEKTALGLIKWDGYSKRYCFYPLSCDMPLHSGLLEEVAYHINEAQKKWREGKVF